MSESDVIIEKIANLKEYTQAEFINNSRVNNEIKELITGQETRLRKLEDWKLVFVAKYTVYSSIALFLGSTLATLMIHYLSKYF